MFILVKHRVWLGQNTFGIADDRLTASGALVSTSFNIHPHMSK